jgi:hypothetical protein
MPATKQVRRSVSLPAPIAKQVDRMAKAQRLSDNRVLVELIELGIEARKQKEKAFFELAERFRSASDPDEAKQLGDELGRMVFGEECRKLKLAAHRSTPHLTYCKIRLPWITATTNTSSSCKR